MKKMNEKKFLQQVYTKLENQLKQEVKLADDSIEILDGDKVIFKIDSKGDIFYAAGKQYSNIVNKLHGKIENDVRNTKEFLKVMDNSPELTAVDLNAPYKKLLEYKARLTIIKGNHFIANKRPAEFNQAVDNFLKKV